MEACGPIIGDAMNLILLRPDEIGRDGTVVLDNERATHVRTVLRASPGQTLRVGLIDGPAGTATVRNMNDATVVLERLALGAQPPPRPAVDLLLAVPRPKVLRRIWAQIAAIGVGRVMLTNAARVERNYFDTHWLAPDTYVPLLVEGLQQARDTRLPVVTVHRQFRPLVEDVLAMQNDDALRLVAEPGEAVPVDTAVRARQSRRVLLAVGPEGGWNAYELDLLVRHAFVRVAMGPRPLRTDTACIAALALCHAALAEGAGERAARDA